MLLQCNNKDYNYLWSNDMTMILITVFVALIFLITILILLLIAIKTKYSNLLKSIRSNEVRRGITTEQWIPLLSQYPWDPSNFHFIGNPIDGIQFEEDKVILIEFKSGNSKLSPKQKSIKKLVENKQCEFQEIHLKMSSSNQEFLEIN